MSLLTTSNFSGNQCSTNTPQPTAYESTPCYNGDSNNGFTFKGNKSPYPLNGTYFFTGPVTIQGNAVITGTATLILFGNATLTITGNPSIQLTAVKNPQVPPVLSSVQSLMTDLLIYDPETTNPNQSVKITGDSQSYFNGIVYVPNSPLNYAGNTSATVPPSASGSNGCYEVIASAVQFSGNPNLDNSKCIRDGAGILPPKYVRLVPP
jgi:hypothetical protein